MNKEDALIAEYNNLWQEKLVHKQSFRKFQNIITYLITIASVTLTLMGLSASELMKSAMVGVTPNIISNLPEIIAIISIPLTPLFILFMSFAVNDMYQIYVIGNHIGHIEKRLNSLLNFPELLTWEHIVCPIVFGGKSLNINSNKKHIKISNIARMNTSKIFLPFLAVLYFVPLYFSLNSLCNFNIWVFLIYLVVNAYLLASLALITYKLGNYIKANSDITKVMDILYESQNDKITLETSEVKPDCKLSYPTYSREESCLGEKNVNDKNNNGSSNKGKRKQKKTIRHIK